jgi:tRNA (cmo5U34)-methyltransferase
MTTAQAPYRWNTSAAAEAYDAAAPVIHPYYAEVQDQILNHLSFGPTESFELVDLGGGSGRLVERVLEGFAGARVTVVDQSDPFLALAERRLARFAPRAMFVQCKLQDWPYRRVSPKLGYVNVIVSTSAIHHLEPREKRELFACCFEALARGGMLINGDEYRPAADAEYRSLLKQWSARMYSALDAGRIPTTFRQTLDHWHDRNLGCFGEPKSSGDDVHETIVAQAGCLREVGFAQTEIAWAEELWAVIVARKRAT